MILFFVGLVAGFICGAIAAFFMQPKQEPDQCRTAVFCEGSYHEVLKLPEIPKIGDTFTVAEVRCIKLESSPHYWEVNWKLEPTK